MRIWQYYSVPLSHLKEILEHRLLEWKTLQVLLSDSLILQVKNQT